MSFRIQKQSDGSFTALDGEGVWYALVVGRPGARPHPVAVSTRLDMLRSIARYHATGTSEAGPCRTVEHGQTVEIWQAAPGTWSDPETLLEAYGRDGTVVVHANCQPPRTANG